MIEERLSLWQKIYVAWKDIKQNIKILIFEFISNLDLTGIKKQEKQKFLNFQFILDYCVISLHMMLLLLYILDQIFVICRLGIRLLHAKALA